MSNINGYLDFEGLKEYHKLAGYSEIPITGYTEGKYLNMYNGTDGQMADARVTDFIKLPADAKCTITSTVTENRHSYVICFYDENSTYISGEEFTDHVSFKLSEKKSSDAPQRVAAQFRVAVKSELKDVVNPLTIRSIHENVIDLLSDRVVENDTTIKIVRTTIGNVRTDIASIQGNISSIQGDVASVQGDISSIQSNIETNSTDINNVKNMVYKAHCSHMINISPTIVEIGTSTSVYVSKLNFLFNNVAQSAADGVTSAKVYNTSNVEITGINASNINTGVGQSDTTKLGTPNSTITVNPGYEIVYNGNPFRGSYTISAVHPTYYGGGTASTIAGGSDVSMTKDALKGKFGSSSLKTGASGTYDITLGSPNYIFIVSPYTISTSNIFNASTGFQFPMESLGTITVTDIGNGIANATYNVYRSTNELDSGTYKIQIK